MARSCPNCQSETSDDAAFCPECGAAISQSTSGSGEFAAASPTSPSSTYSYASTATPGQGTSSTSFNFDIARLSSADRITGGASVVLLIALFLPWFGFSGFGSVDGLSTHGYLYIALLLIVALLVYIGARAGRDRLPINSSLAHAPLMLVATLVNFVLVALAFLFKPAGFGWQFGAFLALIAAAAAAAPIAIPAFRSRQSARN
jgi:hypothetical protein